MTASSGAAQQADATETMSQSTAREADLSDQQARAHFAVGRAMYEAGRFTEAASEFQQAYDLSHRPQLLFNLYIACRDSQQIVRARDALRLYLSEVQDVPDRLHLAARLEALEQQVTDLETQEAESRRLETERAAAQQAATDAHAAREAAEQRALALTHVRPWWPWLLFGAGLAATGAGVPMGIDAASQADAIRLRCTQPDGSLVCRSTELAANRDGIVVQAAVGDALWIAGAAVATTGLVLAFLLPDDIIDGSAPAAAASCSSTGCYGQLTLHFD